jgi:hypothetical protein
MTFSKGVRPFEVVIQSVFTFYKDLLIKNGVTHSIMSIGRDREGSPSGWLCCHLISLSTTVILS